MANFLIVDDDPHVRHAMWLCLDDLGFSARCAGDGQEALDLLTRGFVPDALLIDEVMPTMAGSDLLAELDRNATLRWIPRAIITADHVAPHEGECVLRKPFTYDELKLVAEKLLAAAALSPRDGKVRCDDVQVLATG